MPATHLYISSPQHDRIHLLQGELCGLRHLVLHKREPLGQKDTPVESHQLYRLESGAKLVQPRRPTSQTAEKMLP